jgi:hypothetical protein
MSHSHFTGGINASQHPPIPYRFHRSGYYQIYTLYIFYNQPIRIKRDLNSPSKMHLSIILATLTASLAIASPIDTSAVTKREASTLEERQGCGYNVRSNHRTFRLVADETAF